ncbi:transcription termination/antitermination protein NusA [bacterium]|nr:transcription termination/antitermination protein NusA [bacterium]
MLNLKEISEAIEILAARRGLPKEKVIEVLEGALAAAYKKEYRKKTEIVRAKIDLDTGKVKFWQAKIVVEPSMLRGENEPPEFGEDGKPIKIKFNPDRHILIEEAKKINPQVKPGDEIRFELSLPKDKEFGRIAAQTAKQVILQKIREAERETIFEDFKRKEGQIVSGIVQRVDKRNVYVDLGKAVGLMPFFEAIPSEHYRAGQRLKFYISSVEKDSKGPKIILSRAHPKFVSRLFWLEVPEIQEGLVEIKAIAREPGSRTKIAVASKEKGIDPVGSVVGQRGTRVMAVLNEISPEKIDVIEWSEDPEKFVANALAPAKIKYVKAYPKREMRIFVDPDQLSLAIGKGGQNVRLAAKLTNLKIDVRSVEEPEKEQQDGVAHPEEEKEEEK